ncbi:MAG: FmdE family protein [Candidatus Hodarchaeota archaeon]
MEAKELMEKAARFHGHICPGLAIGVLVAKHVLEHGYNYSPNEELVAVVENDNCSVDALQVILGTTYGKGNLVHRDYGKMNYSIYDRRTQKGIKLALKSRQLNGEKLTRDEKIQFLLKSKPEDVFKIDKIEFNPPGLAQIEESAPCEICGEITMSSRLMIYNDSEMCVPCYKKIRG